MKRMIMTAGLILAMTGSALAGSKNDDQYDLYVIADEVTDSVVYVVAAEHKTVALEIIDEDEAHWVKTSNAHKIIDRSKKFFGPDKNVKKKGFAFVVDDDDVKISFPLLFFKHISIHASEDGGAQINVTSKDGEGDVSIRADDDGAFITVADADADGAREFIDDIEEAPKAMRKKMKSDLGL